MEVFLRLNQFLNSLNFAPHVIVDMFWIWIHLIVILYVLAINSITLMVKVILQLWLTVLLVLIYVELVNTQQKIVLLALKEDNLVQMENVKLSH